MEPPILKADTHEYFSGDALIPGVTTILKPIIDYSDIDPNVLKHKAMLGTYVHFATELYDTGILDFNSLDPLITPYVSAWVKFLDDTDFIIEQTEHVVFYERYLYAGTLDRVGLLNDCRIVLDIKCVSTLTNAVGVQLSAYQEAENSIRKKADHIKKRFALQLKPDSSYRLEPYSNKTDFKIFTSLLTVYNWRLKNGNSTSTW